MNDKRFAAVLPGFIWSWLPKVVLRMDGCYDLFVNRAHEREFKQGAFRVLDSLAEYPAYLEEQHGEMERLTQAPIHCYCDKLGAAHALRGEFCAFDRIWTDRVPEGVSGTSIGYFNVKLERDGSREYAVFVVHLRQFIQEASQSFVETYVLPFASLKVRISHDVEAGQAIPTTFRFAIFGVDDTLIEEGSTTLNIDKGYSAFHDILSGALRHLEDDKSMAWTQDWTIKKVADLKEVDYHPVEGFLGCLFQQHRTKPSLISALRATQQRLFDALVLVPKVDPIIERLRKGREILDHCKNVADRVLLNGIQASLSFEDLIKEEPILVQNGRSVTGGSLTSTTREEITMQDDCFERPRRWGPYLDLYLDKKAIQFDTKEERNRVIEALWKDPELIGVPRNYGVGKVLIVPSEAVDIIQARGFKFHVLNAEGA